jgi:hypothetical protein
MDVRPRGLATWRDPELWLTGSPQSVCYPPPHSVRAPFDNVLPALEAWSAFSISSWRRSRSAFAAFLFVINWENHHTVPSAPCAKGLGLGLMPVPGPGPLGKPLL